MTDPHIRSVRARHPTTKHWRFPDPERALLAAPLKRVSLRDLEARPGRFEHHLMIVARVGGAQLEVAAASEPLYFAHLNVSDEYALAMQTGDELVDALRFRTFLSDPDSLQDLARLLIGAGDLALHPFGFLHWPGRLRAPYAPFEFSPGMRRTGYSLVYCASRPTPVESRPIFVSTGRQGDAKLYGERAVPLLIADTHRESARTVAVVGDTRFDLLVQPERVAPARGGYLVVLGAAPAGPHFAGDLVFLPPGAELGGEGIDRALLLSSSTAEPQPPPPSWQETPAPPFAPFEDARREPLPVAFGRLAVEEAAAGEVRVRAASGEARVPRYWLARLLFRLALHDYRLGYVETYGGFFYDDREGRFRLGLRGGDAVEFSRSEIARVVELLYRAVAPDGYVERLT